MSGRHDAAIVDLMTLLRELPAEFSERPGSVETRESFSVIKKRNVRTVHDALWGLQEYFGLTDE